MVMQTFIQRLLRSTRLMITKGIVKQVDDSGGLQRLQVTGLKDEVLDNRDRYQEYGFTSNPLPGAQEITASIGGNRSNTVIIAVDDRRYRLKAMAPGEVALYDDQGQVIHIKRNGIEVTGNNILLQTDGVCRIDADILELHARTSMQDDVAGLGKRRTHLGGLDWRDDNYTDTPDNLTSVPHSIDAPDIPSSHPEAS